MVNMSTLTIMQEKVINKLAYAVKEMAGEDVMLMTDRCRAPAYVTEHTLWPVDSLAPLNRPTQMYH